MKAKEDTKDASYDTFMGNVLGHRRRRKASQTISSLNATVSSDFDSDSKESNSSGGSGFGDDEGEEEDQKEEEEE